VKFVRRLGETVDTAIVPKKREIPVGTLRSILNQAHIDLDQWDQLG
jgi:predicted RNA binding protein YcfA (HicA-like mRNA interferase family)